MQLRMRRYSAFGALVALALMVSTATKAQVAGPFEGLQGTWAGTGDVTLNNGEKERIRCRITYAVGRKGMTVRQELRCASDSYKFELVADVETDKEYLAGRWTERSRNVGGTVSGRARPGLIEALTESSGFSAFLNISTRGDRQSVEIKSHGSEVTQVLITLRRSR
jgi:hypothetical protein